MTKTSDGAKLQPQFDPDDNEPTFAEDLTLLSDFFAARSYQHYATVANLLAAIAGKSVDDLAIAATVPGARFRFNGATWDMLGVPEFSSAAARAIALPSPAVGWMSRVATEAFDRRYNGTAWIPWGAASFSVIPVSATGTGVSFSTFAGTVTAAAATAASGCTVRGVFTDDFDIYRVHIEQTGASTGNTLLFQLVDTTGAVIGSGYDLVLEFGQNNAPTSVAVLNGASVNITNVGTLASIDILVSMPKRTLATLITGNYFSLNNPGVASVMTKADFGVLQRATTQADGFKIGVSSGTADFNISVSGLSKA